MKEQILDRLARLLKYFKGLEHENNEKEYAYILKGTINGITYSIKLNDCDYWDSKYCCKYCRWLHGEVTPNCEDCNPMDI